jgi:branched-subunit amino acid aminotransferase/4-amino-4-deoxychorismate lyase
MLEGQFFRFESPDLVSCSESVSEIHLAAADSFLVEDGKTRSLQAHFDRFRSWCRAASTLSDAELTAFFAAVVNALPSSGRWFPRIELHLASSSDQAQRDLLYLRLRTAPEQLAGITLWTLDEPDPRSNPEVKGPDLSLCMQLRRRAQLHGADETVILGENGLVSEGALSSLVWWREDTLYSSDSATRWLHSITRDEVFSIAESLGYRTATEAVTPEQLAGLEIWALSSLQGIRPVVAWHDLPGGVGAAKHLGEFQRRLRMLASQVQI